MKVNFYNFGMALATENLDSLIEVYETFSREYGDLRTAKEAMMKASTQIEHLLDQEFYRWNRQPKHFFDRSGSKQGYSIVYSLFINNEEYLAYVWVEMTPDEAFLEACEPYRYLE